MNFHFNKNYDLTRDLTPIKLLRIEIIWNRFKNTASIDE